MANTRAIINAILDDSLDAAETTTLPIFNLDIPTSLGNLDAAIFDPRNSYDTASDWDGKARDLAQLFVDNFTKFNGTEEGRALVAAGPQL